MTRERETEREIHANVNAVFSLPWIFTLLLFTYAISIKHFTFLSLCVWRGCIV